MFFIRTLINMNIISSMHSNKICSSFFIPVLAIVGVGLIGGSFAAALRQTGQVGRVFGVGRCIKSLKDVQASGLIDMAVNPEVAARQADLILFATPVGSLKNLWIQMKGYLRHNTIMTDVCSTKMEVISMARHILGDQIKQFVPGHPIAGTERSGPNAAEASLFKGHNVILTPLDENQSETVDFIRSVWLACGANNVLNMKPKDHDQVLASISHIPHFLSAVYMAQVAQAINANDRLSLAGSGFRDFTRIAAGSVEMWRDIFLSNREAVQAELADVRKVLEQAEVALHEGDGLALQELLNCAAQARRNWSQE